MFLWVFIKHGGKLVGDLLKMRCKKVIQGKFPTRSVLKPVVAMAFGILSNVFVFEVHVHEIAKHLA
jgi:hypothetical protein